ncbi:MAG: hypothetical protein V5804_01440 [Mucilaginibacter sp.]|uniref:hypothetical protein n=1 Tax=Mucilaginibacter sp. TaxID=1882438 RepID=UPI0034E5211B
MNEFKFNIKAFKAVDDIDTCYKYVEGHVNVLKSFGITMITSANTEWFNDPKTYVITIQTEDQDIVCGGARVQVVSDTYQLPIEKALTKFDPKIHDLVNKLATNGTGELCGLWNSREVAGLGLGARYLGWIGIAISTQLNLNTLFALCAPATVKSCIKMGFLIETSLGNNGTFYYPKEDLIATAALVNDVVELSTAGTEERNRIFDLRKNPIQIKHEIGPRGQNMEIDYSLIIPNL